MEAKSSPSVRSVNTTMLQGEFKTLCPPISFDCTETILIRHGESIQEVFPDWVDRSRLDKQYYLPFDLNVPIQIPRRENMRAAYKVDPPLSEIGKMTTQLLAREIADRRAGSIDIIYSSPALSCLQTAYEIQSFLGARCGAIRVNSALITTNIRKDYWFRKDELERMGYRMDSGYDVQKLRNEVENDVFDFEAIVRRLKKFSEGLKSSIGTVLIVSDSLATKILTDVANRIFPMQSLGEDPRVLADVAFPPSSTYTLRHEKGLGGTSLEPSPYNLRNVTCIGASSQPNRDPTVN